VGKESGLTTGLRMGALLGMKALHDEVEAQG